jgi:hypothetical protein
MAEMREFINVGTDSRILVLDRAADYRELATNLPRPAIRS